MFVCNSIVLFFDFQGVGTVVSGTTLKGVIRLNDTLMLGPDPLGHFQPIAVKSIHRKRMAVREVRAGQTASFALKKVYLMFIIYKNKLKILTIRNRKKIFKFCFLNVC